MPFMYSSWLAKASREYLSILAHLNQMGMATRRNLRTSSLDRRMTSTPAWRYLGQASRLAF